MASKSLREKALTALRQLIRRQATASELDAIFTSIRRGNERSNAILGATIVEESLKQALLSKFRSLTNDETDRLFGPDQPLGSFSAKSKLAYALDLCSQKEMQNLDSIRQIRNAFAHDMKPLSFKKKEVNEVCNHLHLPERLGQRQSRPREQFLWVVGDLTEKFWPIAFPDAAA